MVPQPDWVVRNPELARWLDQLDETDCIRFEDEPEQLSASVLRWLPEVAQYTALTAVADLRPAPEVVATATLAEREATDMPGRKRLQAGALCAALSPLSLPALDWCCGKGHLSRTLARHSGLPVTGFEWNPALVEDGNRLARRFGEPLELQPQDVMAAGLRWPDRVHGTALHACGDLHRKLIRDGVRLRQPRLSFSPCCYHLTGQQNYRPLSERARGHQPRLALSRDELRLAVQETVTAPLRVREQTERARQWRLGFDGLQRTLREEDSYLPLPPHPSRLLNQGFEAFARWAAARKGLALPAHVDWIHWEGFGAARLRQVRRYELIRHLFRRPLELWLVFDYALYLEEAGYQVRLGTFCERSLTPRNLLVDAVRD
ncbi:methyltransferase [Marinobacter sp.]|uniref:methyltransferase n=1 Tax=Marinobacter sp. TaxID=50741 RepID=UPI003567B37E